MSLREKLVAHGVPEAEIDEAERNGTLLELAVDRILVGQPRYTSEEIAERADMDIEVLRRLWRALGFTDTDERIFTDADLEAIGWVRRYNDEGLADLRVTTQLTRVVGSSLARIAEAQVDVLTDRIAAVGGADLSQEQADARSSCRSGPRRSRTCTVAISRRRCSGPRRPGTATSSTCSTPSASPTSSASQC